MPYLLDASALLNIIVSRGQKALDVVRGHFVLDLTSYEAGNTLWRLSVLQNKLTSETVDSTLEVLAKLMEQTKEMNVHSMNLLSIMNVARNERTTFYDSAYITAAKDRKLTLVTDDGRLSKAASKYVEVRGSAKL